MASPRVTIRARGTSPGINIEAWTEDIPLSTASLSAALAAQILPLRENRVRLEIPLDSVPDRRDTKDRITAEQDRRVSEGVEPSSETPRRRASDLRRRDSLRRREALLKGKEGSRRRQKWENDHLLGNPAFQPPEPHDWAPHPTHRVHSIPYRLAPLWDDHYAGAACARAERAQRAQDAKTVYGQVPRELREKLKRAKGAKTLLQDLEEQVRGFVREWEEKQRMRAEGWDVDVEESDVEDMTSEEEVIFVGRKTRRRRGRRDQDSEEEHIRRDKLIFDSLVDDHGASFGRWLVHSIAGYYNLNTWSITTGNPARREAYVGIPESEPRPTLDAAPLPMPLWVMV